MVCTICGDREITGITLCKDCLVKIVERRARTAISAAKLWKDANVAVVNDGSCGGKVNEHLARKLVTIAKITLLKSAPKNKYDLVFLPQTADDEAQKLLDFMLDSRKAYRRAENAVLMLRHSLGSEIESYAGIKSIKYAATGKKKSTTSSLITDLEKKFPGTTFSLAKTCEQIKWQE